MPSAHLRRSRLLDAAARGDAPAVTAALDDGAEIESRDSHDRTALLLAATADHVPVAQVLISRGASPDALDDRHDTPWLVTGVTGSVAMLEALLPGDPDLTIRHRRHREIVRILLGAGADRDLADKDGVTALEHARTKGYDEMVAILQE